MTKDEPYFISVDENGCGHCRSGRTWTVVGPDGAAGGRSFIDEEDAADLAEALNEAFYSGTARADTAEANKEHWKRLSLEAQGGWTATINKLAETQAVVREAIERISCECAGPTLVCHNCAALAKLRALLPKEKDSNYFNQNWGGRERE